MRNILKTALSLLVAAQFAGCSTSSSTEHLFNGNDLSNWNLYVDSSTGIDASDVFTVEDGVICCTGVPFGYMFTKQKYSDYDLHVEWRWADGEGSNSGIFLFIQNDEGVLWPNAIETQLGKGKAGDFVMLGGSEMKEFKLEDGEKMPKFPIISKHNESSEAEIGEWNSADITCGDGKIVVTINGIKQNEGTISSDASGYIGLQSEGGAIQFRNVKLTNHFQK